MSNHKREAFKVLRELELYAIKDPLGLRTIIELSTDEELRIILPKAKQYLNAQRKLHEQHYAFKSLMNSIWYRTNPVISGKKQKHGKI
jgi:hypothetical protein